MSYYDIICEYSRKQHASFGRTKTTLINPIGAPRTIETRNDTYSARIWGSRRGTTHILRESGDRDEERDIFCANLGDLDKETAVVGGALQVLTIGADFLLGPNTRSRDRVREKNLKLGLTLPPLIGPVWPSRDDSNGPRVVIGDFDPYSIYTSYAERNNLTIRTFLRRFARLSLGFLKQFENLVAAVRLHVVLDNFCRRHSTLRMGPAMAAGATDELRSLDRLIEEIRV